MKAIDLTPKHIEALTFMFGKQLTLSGIARQLKWERALAANIVGSLKSAGFLSEYSNGTYGLSPAGRNVLIETGFKAAERKAPGARTGRPKKARVSEAPAVSVEPAEHLDAMTASIGMANDAGHVSAQPVFVDGKLTGISVGMRIEDFAGSVDEKIAIQLPPMGNLQIEKATLSASPSMLVHKFMAQDDLPDPSDTAALVHCGIAKLIGKLNGKPAIISNAQFKFAALNNLANGIEAAEPNVANLLREIAMDIHKAAGLGGDQ